MRYQFTPISLAKQNVDEQVRSSWLILLVGYKLLQQSNLAIYSDVIISIFFNLTILLPGSTY